MPKKTNTAVIDPPAETPAKTRRPRASRVPAETGLPALDAVNNTSALVQRRLSKAEKQRIAEAASATSTIQDAATDAAIDALIEGIGPILETAPAPPEPIILPAPAPIDMPTVRRNLVLLNLRTAGFNNSRKIERSKISERAMREEGADEVVDLTAASSEDAVAVLSMDKKSANITIRLLKSDTLDALYKFDATFRNWLKSRKVTDGLFRSGVYALNVQSIPEINKKVQEYIRDRAVKVDAFVAEYPACKEQAKRRLRKAYSDLYYPQTTDALRSLFRVDFMWTSLQAPSELSALDPEQYRIAQEAIGAQIEEASELGRKMIRAEFREMVGNMRSILTETAPSGRKKTLRKSALPKIVDWLDAFRSRDITNDVQLQTLVDEAKRVLSNVTDNRLRTDDQCRETVARTFAQVTETMREFMVDAPARVFDLPEDDDTE